MINNYIKNNIQKVKYEVLLYGLANVVEELNNMFHPDKINISKLSAIIQYESEVVENEGLPWRLKLPDFKQYQTIVNYIKQHSHIVVKYVDIVGYKDLGDEIMLMTKEKVTYTKLSNIISYIKDTNDN